MMLVEKEKFEQRTMLKNHASCKWQTCSGLDILCVCMHMLTVFVKLLLHVKLLSCYIVLIVDYWFLSC